MPLTVIFEDEDLYSRQPSEKALLVAAVRRHHRGTLLNRVPRIFVKAVVCSGWHKGGTDAVDHATVEFFSEENDELPQTEHVLRGRPRSPDPALRRDWAGWLLPAVAVTATTVGNGRRGGGGPEASGSVATTSGGAGSGQAGSGEAGSGEAGLTDEMDHATVEFVDQINTESPHTAHVLRGPPRPPEDPALRCHWAPWLVPAAAVTATTGPVVCVRVVRGNGRRGGGGPEAPGGDATTKGGGGSDEAVQAPLKGL
ncbi:MAG: hypothetical protein M1826_002522 [Phylliscum demangeonii]|nr:MAG: hypothetical protein M1826_002522 [Phylliscum demangeonii]